MPSTTMCAAKGRLYPSNPEFHKVTKAKSVFPTDDSLLKMLYFAMVDITKKWTGRRQDWSQIHAQLGPCPFRPECPYSRLRPAVKGGASP